MSVNELLRAHVVTIPPDAAIRDMVDLLDLYQVLLLPVVDADDRLVGAVYEELVMTAVFGNEAAGLGDPALREAAVSRSGGIAARDIMLAPSVAIDEHADTLDALDRMSETGLTRLPVTSGGKVIGTISRVDICQALLEGEL
jgi:CBS domain-containing protein